MRNNHKQHHEAVCHDTLLLERSEEDNRILRDLRERVKELTGLNAISRLLHDDRKELREVLTQVVEAIPPAYQYPEQVAARIIFDAQSYQTSRFRTSPWMQSRTFELQDESPVRIDVARLSVPPDQLPFIPEEEHFLDTIQLLIADYLDRRRSKERLIENERRQRFTQESAHVGSWDLDLVNDRMVWTEECYRIHGLEPGARVETYQNRLDLIHPANRDQVHRNIQDCIARQQENYAFEYRILHPQAEVCWISSRGRFTYDPQGNPLRVGGVFIDITDRKLAEEKLIRKTSELEAVMNAFPDLFFLLSHDGIILDYRAVNSADLYRPPDVFLNQSIHEALPPNAAARVEEAMAETIRTNRVTMIEISLEYSEGLRVFEVRHIPFAADRLYCIARDITERRLTEEKLRIGMAAIESTDDMILIADRQGMIDYVNPAFTRTTGYLPEEVIHQRSIFPDSPDHSPANIEELVRSGQTWQGEIKGRRKDGSDFPEEATLSPIIDDRFQVSRYVAIKRDLTQRREAEALILEKESLTCAIKAMEQVLGVISHELRTPLAGIRAMSEYLLCSGRDKLPEHDEFLQAINDETIRMADMVNDILEVSRLNSGTARWNWSQFRLLDVCREAARTVRPLLVKSDISLDVVVTPENLTMQGDPAAIRRLILNLLSNTHKHTTRGSAEVVIRGEKYLGQETVVIQVIDTGEGIPPDIAAKLGEPFALNSGIIGDQHVKGSGLGFAICKGIASAHGGCIRVQSTVGKGTTVLVRMQADLPGPATEENAIQFFRELTA